MWICSKFGFFSIARKGPPDRWEVRARMETDLRDLLAASGVDSEILRTPDNDYRFRVEVDRACLGRLLASLGDTVDYRSLQDSVRSLPDQREKLPAYESLTEALRQLQNEPASRLDDGRHGSARSPEDVARRFGGHLARMLETLNGFREKYGHWPRRLRLSHAALEALRDRFLTPAGFAALTSKVELVPGETEDFVAEDEAGLVFDYVKESWSGKRPPQEADNWLWQIKL